jgi:hypothetical protein
MEGIQLMFRTLLQIMSSPDDCVSLQQELNVMFGNLGLFVKVYGRREMLDLRVIHTLHMMVCSRDLTESLNTFPRGENYACFVEQLQTRKGENIEIESVKIIALTTSGVPPDLRWLASVRVRGFSYVPAWEIVICLK